MRQDVHVTAHSMTQFILTDDAKGPAARLGADSHCDPVEQLHSHYSLVKTGGDTPGWRFFGVKN